MAEGWVSVATAPEEVRAAASAHGLGGWCTAYGVGGGRVGVTLAKTLGTGALTVFFLVVFAAGFSVSPFFVVLFVLFALAMGLHLLRMVRALAAAGDTVYLFEAGFVHLRGATPRTFAWRDVTVRRELVRRRDHGTIEHTYTVQRPDGTSVVLDHNMYWEIGDLGRAIENGVTRTRLPLAIAAVAAGEAAVFGRFTVDAEGVRDGDRERVPWAEVAGIHVSNGYLGVRTTRSRRPRTHPVKDVPNVFVFVALVEAVLQATGSRG